MIIKWLNTLCDRIFAIGCALLFSQIPSFINQYLERLSGHVEELKFHIKLLTKAASFTHKTLEEYVKKFLSSSDIDFFHQGEMMQQSIERFNTLNFALTQLKESSIVYKPFAFAYYLDPAIASSTFHEFYPALIFNIESLCYAFVGFFTGLALFHFLKNLFKIPFKHTIKNQQETPSGQ